MADPSGMHRGTRRTDQVTDGQGRWIGGRRSARTLLTALAAAVIALALTSPSAPALTTHSFATEFSIGGNCGQSGYGEQFAGPHDLATDAAGNLYVMCSGKGPNGLWGSIRKFHPNGTPYPFTGNAPYVEGNEINEDPVAPRKSFGEKAWIAVDRSSARPGWIYVADASTGLEDPPNTGGGPKASEHVDIFNPAGEYVTSLISNEFQANTRGVGVDDEGYVYVGWEGASHYIAKYNPATFREIARILPSTPEGGVGGPCCTIVHPDSNGAVWVGWCGGYDCEPTAEFGKYEADQWTTDLRPVSKNPDAIVAEESPFLKEGFPGVDCPPPFEYAPRACQLKDGDVTQFSGNFNVDLRDNNVFTVDGGVVTSYSEGNAEDPVHQNGPTFGEGFLGGGGRAITIDNEGNVWVGAAPSKIVKFAPGPTLPKVITRPVTLADIGHYTATVHLHVDPDGGGPVTQCKAAYDLLSSSSYGSSVSCNPPTPYGQAAEVTATLTGLEPGKNYRVRGEAANAAGTGLGAPRGFEARAVLDVETNPATGVGRNEATLNGQLDADGIPTEYWYQYGPTSFYGLTTLDSQGKGVAVTGAPGEIKQAPFTLNHLQSGRVYHFRLVARNELGVTVGQDKTFRTVSPPEIAGVGAEHVTDTEADLHAQINPVGYPTTYLFEYGTTPAYGSTIPVSGNELNGNTPQKVEVHLTGLPAGDVIHYRVVATNEWGTNSSDDTTFSFRPPNCPNAHIRQVTGTSYLPDCRAYELVSPGYAGAVQFLPGEALTNFGGTFTLEGVIQTPQNLGYARSPSRFMYWGGLGAINGINTPNSFLDVYLATRTTTGWVTAMPGLKGNETQFSWGRVCSEDLSICADHIGSVYVKNPETGLEEEIPKSQAPYLYRADAKKLGRVPSNVAVIPKGAELAGDWMFSGDFSHFVFSTQTRFTTDGISARPGSVYDNDVSAGTLEVISKDANNNDIAPEPSQAGDPRRVTGIVAVSNDGSRVLMAGTTNPSCKASEHFGCPHVLNYPVRLYLRNVPAKVTYEVSEGHEVNYVGTTADGRTVFFTSTEQLTPGDNDTSRDLYMWDETDGQIHLISRNGSLGNDDACAASWVGKCGVLPLTPLYTDYSEHFDFKTRVEGIDDVLARNSGDIYFYSPEDLVPGEVGGDGQRNLYLYRNGQLHLVSTLEPGAGVERSTISQDGSHAAFMTRSNLTAYDSHGQKEVYAYNAETGVLRCASCNPNGRAPKPGGQVITVAESGHFMSDDGRVFFGTKEALVPQDTDGIRDVYEYVDGRAQLITSGTGQRENTGGLELFSFFFGTLQVGLESVSRDGTDVYFATFETLTPEDKNGSFLKFYDARSGGGFDFTPELGPCAAADECHGVSSQPPVRASVGTGAAASGGNLPMLGKQKKKHHRKKHHGHHAKRQGGGRNG
jgi:hypothetical protein